jgi:hypothetical protein
MIWALLMITIGLFLTISSFIKSDFVVYRLLVVRAQVLWGKHVHQMFIVSGIVIVLIGLWML